MYLFLDGFIDIGKINLLKYSIKLIDNILFKEFYRRILFGMFVEVR